MALHMLICFSSFRKLVEVTFAACCDLVLSVVCVAVLDRCLFFVLFCQFIVGTDLHVRPSLLSVCLAKQTYI